VVLEHRHTNSRTGKVFPSRLIRKSWSMLTPFLIHLQANQNSPDIYDFRSQGDDKWVDIDWSDAGIVLENGPPYQVGYRYIPLNLKGVKIFAHCYARLINDPASSIIYHLSSDFGSAVTSSDTGDYGDIGGPSISMYASIDTSYPSTTAVSNQGTDPWSSTNLTTVTASKSWSILNSECNGSMNYTVITVDAHGTVKTYFGTDYLAGNVPTALPANVTFTNGNDTEVVEFYFTGVEPVSAVWGSAYCEISHPDVTCEWKKAN
jgi:hypothetical protein